MDSANGIAVGGGAVAGVLSTVAYVHHDLSLKWGESASTLTVAASSVEDAAARASTDPGAVDRGSGFFPPKASTWTRIADDIEHGSNDMLGKIGPNPYRMPAVAPLRRAGTMSIEAGISELRSAATHATALEASSLHSSKLAMITAGAVAVTAGAAWLGSKLFS